MLFRSAVQSDGRALRMIVATGVLMPEHILLAEGGNANRATAKGLCPVPRIPLIDAMSRASAAIYGLAHSPASGAEFDVD